MEWVSEYVGVYPQRYMLKYLLDLSRGEKCWRQKELELGFVTAPNIQLIYIVVCNLMD